MRTYKNTLIYPIKPSRFESRTSDKISTDSDINGIHLGLPLISAPMDTIDNPEFFKRIREFGGLGTIHRRMSTERQVEIFNNSPEDTVVSVGLNDFDRIDALASAGASKFLIDVANGFSRTLEKTVHFLKERGFWVMAGNVAESHGYNFLSSLRVDAVRVGIGNGAACTTRRMTGIGYPILDAISSCKHARSVFGSGPAIIADGGAKHPSDVVKALFCGANAVMMGQTFAHCVESHEGLRMGGSRTYRGMASFNAQIEDGKAPVFVEGEEFPISVDSSVETTMCYFEGGIRSAMSYLDARTLCEMRSNGKIVETIANDGEGYKGV